jgi:hypothetical protein
MSNAYEPEEYPRCVNCGRMVMHSRANHCSVCLVNETLKTPPPKSPLAHFTASDFTPTAKKR